MTEGHGVRGKQGHPRRPSGKGRKQREDVSGLGDSPARVWGKQKGAKQVLGETVSLEETVSEPEHSSVVSEHPGFYL